MSAIKIKCIRIALVAWGLIFLFKKQTRQTSLKINIKKTNKTHTLKNSELAAALLDAIHNTPGHIVKPLSDNDSYIKMYYQSFDSRWPEKGISLVKIYNEKLCSVLS